MDLTMDEDAEVGIYIPRRELCRPEGQPAVSMKVEMRYHTDPPEDATCSICQEDGVEHNTPCGHWVHPACLEPWLARSDKCPVCRHPLTIICTAHWIHNATDDPESSPTPPRVPEYLRRSSVVIRMDGHTAQIQGQDPSYDPDEDDSTDSLSNSGQGEDEYDEYDDDLPWADSQNHMTINATGHAQVTIQIGSRKPEE